MFMRKALVFAITLLVIVGAGMAQTDDFAETPCPIDLPGYITEGEDIICGFVTVPEQHAQPDGPTIQVMVAIYPARGTNPQPDPVIFLHGGPGASAIGDVGGLILDSSFGRTVLNSRDLVFIEQRGTQFSVPDLQCDEFRDVTYEFAGDVLELEEDLALFEQTVTACRDRLIGEGVNLSAFDSVENAADIEAVRLALGYEQVNIYGSSYGTLLGQHYMRDYPDSIRSAVLDAVVPTDLNFVPEIAVNAQRAFDVLFDACAADSFCSSNYPDLEATLYALVDDLNANPITVSAADDIETFSNFVDVAVTGDDFLNYLFGAFYVTELLPILPDFIYSVRDGEDDLLSLLITIFDFDFSLSDGMYGSVICAEDADYDSIDVTGVDAPLIPVFGLDVVGELCDLWVVEPLDDYVNEPVQSDLPTLLMSGEYDPITPPRFGDRATAGFSNGNHLVFAGTGHGAAFTECGTAIMGQFFDDPTGELDTSCMDALGVTFIPGF